MKKARKRLTYANVMSSLAVFLVLGGASAVAANQLGKNTVGTKQLKSGAVTAAKIKKDAVTGAKIKDGSITGAELNLAKLGTVPSAANADNAKSASTANSAKAAESAKTAESAAALTGHTPFFVRLGFGQEKTIAANGSVSLVAYCHQEGGNDYAEILAQTSQNGAVLSGYDDYNGSSPTDFLQTGTAAKDRRLVSESTSSGDTYVEADIDSGFVLGPDDKMLTVNSEGIALGLNYGAPGCLLAGVVDAVG
ncbi:MAG TPA: hypothetical protein VHA54_03415 [Solirubrobacterales bacterium]|nr:hypothetical protein [Solirubrobacterales bacterium]